MKCIRNLFLAACLALVPTDGFGQTAQPEFESFFDEIAHQNPWTAVNTGMETTSVWALAINDADVLFAGTVEGVFRSSDFGDTWEAAGDIPGDTEITALTLSAEGTLFSATHGNGVFRSFDDGDTWEAVNDSLHNLKVGALGVDLDGVLFAGTFLGGVYRFLPDTNTWELVNDVGLDNPFVPSLAINDENTIFAGSDSGVFRSQDDGDTWEAVNAGLDNLYIESLLLGSDDALFAGTDRGVYRSIDDGNAWEEVNTVDLVGENVRAMGVNSNNAIFAGTHGSGVFRSLNYGEDWEPVNDGLTTLDISSLLIAEDGTMFAGTVGGGVFRRDAATDVSSEAENVVPADFQLAGNFPNPFTASTHIRFALPKQSDVALSIYDVNGRTIAVLAKGARPAGWHEVVFDASHLPNGVYFYRLKADNFTAVKHLVFLK